MSLRLVGRRSSHFTRLAALFAEELGVGLELVPVSNLLSLESADYAGNPGLKMPSLLLETGPLFGALPICRELARRSDRGLVIVWPEDLHDPLLVNAQELTTQAMATQVTVVLARLSQVPADSAIRAKAEAGLRSTIAWLDENLPAVVDRLPRRDLSFLEAGLYCLGTHLAFRDTMPLGDAPRLAAFCEAFGQRPSAARTAYRFD